MLRSRHCVVANRAGRANAVFVGKIPGCLQEQRRGGTGVVRAAALGNGVGFLVLLLWTTAWYCTGNAVELAALLRVSWLL